MKLNIKVETKSIQKCGAGDLIIWGEGKLGLVGIGQNDHRVIIELDSFSAVETADTHQQIHEDFDCVALLKDCTLNLPLAYSIHYANTAKAGDVCVSGTEVLLAYSQGSRPTVAFLRISDGKRVSADTLPKVALFNDWSITLGTNSQLPPLVAKKGKVPTVLSTL